MARNKSYAESMNEWAEEKKFLRKFRHKAFHPDYESPLVARLFGYVLRLAIFLAVVGGILLVRNRAYFNGEAFRDTLKKEVDHHFAAESSELSKVAWKSGRGTTTYKATGGPHAFYKEMEAGRVRFLGNWKEMLLQDNWNLREVEIGELRMTLKGGETSAKPAAKTPPPRESSWWTATPNLETCKFDRVRLETLHLAWGPHWSTQGKLADGTGALVREASGWKLELAQGTLTQNWFQGLRLSPKKPLSLSIKNGALVLREAEVDFGQNGHGTLQGIVTLGEAPMLDLAVELKTVKVEELLPEEFHEYFTGVGDLSLKVKGSTNTRDGVVTEGSFTIVEKGRVREMPILRSLSVLTGKAELRSMPLSKSRIDFSTKRGVMTVKAIDLVSGEIARVRGSFSYDIDTRALESAVTDVKPRTGSAGEKTEQPRAAPGEFGFKGALQLGLPWNLLGQDTPRDTHFKRDSDGWGWLEVPMSGSMKEVTSEQANVIDHQLADLAKRARNPFENPKPPPSK